MSDINAAPSSTEPAAAGDNVNATEVQTRAQEVGTAVSGESSPSTSADSQSSSGDDPNAAASPAADQSASDTASSAQGVSQGDGTAADVSHDDVVGELHAALMGAKDQIAELEQQVTDEQERVIKWQSMYNAACAAKPHAQSLLQKLEAGEAIVLGDLQSRLRSFVDAL
ncbi:hypothetical protein [Burkholderia cenocepacia]|uniref:hypothetical protein n=1 Tax=Burkholderia cenocepacia TaxID=95486 RepID=UPI001B96F5C4|nr:hypothetical protein [Burkholderia cenocepacia]MBR7942345.1 hypothetical protein [Burkholderia cenocepacia]